MIPIQTARVVDQGIATNDSDVIIRTITTMGLLVVFGMGTASFAGAMAVRMSFFAVTDLRQALYEHAHSLSFGNLDRRPSGELLTRLTSDITKIQAGLIMGIAIISRAPFMLVGTLVAIVLLEVSLTVVAIGILPFVFVVFWFVVGRSGPMYGAVQQRLDRLNTVLQENIEGAALVKSFVRQDHQTERFAHDSDDLAYRAIRVNQLVASLAPALIGITGLGLAAVLWIGGSSVIDGALTEGTLVAFVSYMALLSIPLTMFAFLQPMLTAAGASMNRIEEVLNEPPYVVDQSDAQNEKHQTRPGEVRFEGVSFAYGAAENPANEACALVDINLHIEAGEKVAILGATGSGKSSLAHLIPRFYDPTSGVVSVGGVPAKSQSLEKLRSSVSVALQTPKLFSGTIADNIRGGRLSATDSEVVAAATVAQAHGFISEKARGYSALVEQGGANLSGGQRQRISIARSLAADPEILILDDSTSAVDLTTEVAIQNALADQGDRTVILIAQRISTALGADSILVMDGGRLVARGTHNELMEQSEVYREIYRSQLGEPVH